MGAEKTPFQTALDFVLGEEGGYSNMIRDSGGETKYGISKRCVSPDSLVLTADLDWVSAASLVVGDLLLAFDEVPERRGKLNVRRFRVATVDAVGPVIVPASRVITDSRSFVASDDHQWLRRWGTHRIFKWSRTADLLRAPGKWTNGVEVRIAKLCDPWSVLQTREAGYLAGVLDGEGSISGDLEFSQKKGNALVEQAIRCADTIGLKFIEENLRHGVCSYRLCGDDSPFFHITTVAKLGARRLQSIAARQLVGKTIASTKNRHDSVISVESVGERELVGITTSTRTLIVDGYLSHNSYPDLNIRALTLEDAEAIYRRDYWSLAHCDELPAGLSLLVFDSAVNQGVGAAARCLQRSLGVPEDGKVGPQTLAAARATMVHEPAAVMANYCAERALRYANSPGLSHFGGGWFRRLFRAYAAALEEALTS